MLEKIKQFLEVEKVPKFRVKQLDDMIWKNFMINFNDMTNFNKDLREKLINQFGESVCDLKYLSEHKTADTVKFVLETLDGNVIETVLMIHEDGRRTVCVSSQIFCALGCKFCATGANKYKRNLTKDEILAQVMFVNDYLRKNEVGKKVTNVVYMGMGEPFLNYINVKSSILDLNNPDLFNIGARHITVSTSGIVPRIYEFIDIGIQVRLAISLHAPNDELRSELMPINEKYPLKELFEALDTFVEKNNKRVSYEYVLINEINDTEKCARELVRLLRNRLSHVNLLVYNPHPFADYTSPSKTRVLNFKRILDDAGIECSIRRSMGDDISGACGQLAGKKD